MTPRLLVLCALALAAPAVEPAPRAFALEGIAVTAVLGEEWKQVAAGPKTGIVLLKEPADGVKLSLVINRQPNSRGLAALKEAYERDFQRVHANFTLVSSTLEKLGEIPVLRLVHDNETFGKPMRQHFYIFDFGPVSCNATFSVLREQGDRHDAEFAAIAASLRRR